ncbi:hypothetical protein CB0940_05490 [Cercospora beticola]|uniref:Uncharacterized protein n=1 Tax=Cercospora beticola TaxID=122368 RepID=A0A2G5HXZ7_CERBT|nr:hypothetical protein CB0940_05490 [Cercospora beticola]PIA97396.1 hypothetical protein CB0940_05490 [Cercospora beticola]WPA98041.1 hypothetical protein RHO25_002652 [Cercospora beticola]CAK1359252.1 unnamed protein product [Cercospora beticola]
MKLRSGRVVKVPKKEISQAAQRLQLLGIPPELRLIIYLFLLIAYYRIYDFRCAASIEHPILHVSAFIRNEVLWDYNTALKYFTTRLYDISYAACDAYASAACEWLDHVISIGVAGPWSIAARTTLLRLQIKKTEAFDEYDYVVDVVKDCLEAVEEQIVKWQL